MLNVLVFLFDNQYLCCGEKFPPPWMLKELK